MTTTGAPWRSNPFLCRVEALLGEKNETTEAQHHAAASHAARDVGDVVAEDRGDESDQCDQHDVEAPRPRVDRRTDQDGFARDGTPKSSTSTSTANPR